MTEVDGFCPMGCGATLFLGFDTHDPRIRRVLCSNPTCPDPYAAAAILSDAETEHVVVLQHGGYSVKHPLRERLGDQLLACSLADHIAEFGPEYASGGVFGDPIPLDVRHRVWWVGDGEDSATEWERIAS